MSKHILVIAPHPDDETLGCGGTLLRHLHEGDHLYWLLLTEPEVGVVISEEKMIRREVQKMNAKSHQPRKDSQVQRVKEQLQQHFQT